jgi:hypothetical protein
MILSDDGVHLESNDVSMNQRWTAFERVDALRGDIFLFDDTNSAMIIPAKTFANLAEADHVRALLRGKCEQARSMRLPTGVGDQDGAWPPIPMLDRSSSRPDPAGPVLLAEETTTLECEGGLIEKLSTDFATIRIDTQETSTAFRVSALHRVAFSAGRVYIYLSPSRSLIVPAAAFPSPADARAFARRLSVAVRRGKREARG